MLARLQKKLGNKWVQIAEQMPGRSENGIKNRWNSAKRRVAKASLKLKNATTKRRKIIAKGPPRKRKKAHVTTAPARRSSSI